MYRHTGFSTTIAALGLAVMLAPSSGCSPSAMPDTTTHPADPHAPTGAAAPEVTDAHDQPTPDAHAGHGAPAGHDAHDHGGHAGHGASAGHDAQTPSPETAQAAEALLVAEQDAYQRAKPVLDKYCAKCHSGGGKKARKATLAHFSMDTYPFGGHHETEMGEVMRAVLGVTGKRPTMPEDQPGIVQGEELASIVAWSEAFDRSHAAGLHDHGSAGAHGAGHQHGATNEPAGKHQHGTEKKPGKAPARDSNEKRPAPKKKPDATHQHGKGHEGHQHGSGHDHEKGHGHGHH
jgi:hypothetical protein